MKKAFILAGLILFTMSVVVAQGKKKKEKESVTLTSHTDTISYILGSDIGKNIKKGQIEVNHDVFCLGLKQGYEGTDNLFTKEQVEQIMQQFQKDMEAKADGAKQESMKDTKAKGDAYAAENKKKPGVIELPGGLQYKIIKEGTGPNPTSADTVTVYYKGMLTDGTVFDATKEGEPVSFPLGNLIKGWTEGIQLMKVGSTFEFVIPPSLGYGDREVGPIPAGSTLVFTVELLEIKPGN